MEHIDLIMKVLAYGYNGRGVFITNIVSDAEFNTFFNMKGNLPSRSRSFIDDEEENQTVNRRIRQFKEEHQRYKNDTLRFARDGYKGIPKNNTNGKKSNLNSAIQRIEEQLDQEGREGEERIFEEEKVRVQRGLTIAHERDLEEERMWVAREAAEAARVAAAREAAEAARVAALVARGRWGRQRFGEVGTGRRVDGMHVHIESAKYLKFIPGIVSIIQKEIGVKDYSDIMTHIDSTIGNFLRTDEEYLKYKFNSGIQTRDKWIADYTRVIDRLSTNIAHATKEQKDMMGYIIDCVFKYDLQSCFCRGYIYDTAHAYDGDEVHEEYGSTVSCWAGSVERVLTTFINCIKGVNEPVIVKINDLIEEKKTEGVTSWKDLDKPTQVSYIKDWNNFFEEWVKSNVSNNSVKRLNSNSKKVSIMTAFKASRGNSQLPSYVEDYIKNELLREIAWEDYGFNSENGGQGGAEGGRRRKTRHKRKTRKAIRKQKKSLKRR